MFFSSRIFMPHGAVFEGVRKRLIHQNPRQHESLHMDISGTGMGSQLLGGSGGASSYMSVSDYAHTTGHNPYAGGGIGMKRLADKLENLHYRKKARDSNIHFSI